VEEDLGIMGVQECRAVARDREKCRASMMAVKTLRELGQSKKKKNITNNGNLHMYFKEAIQL